VTTDRRGDFFLHLYQGSGPPARRPHPSRPRPAPLLHPDPPSGAVGRDFWARTAGGAPRICDQGVVGRRGLRSGRWVRPSRCPYTHSRGLVFVGFGVAARVDCGGGRRAAASTLSW